MKKYALVESAESIKGEWNFKIFSIEGNYCIISLTGSNIVPKKIILQLQQALFDVIQKMEYSSYLIELKCQNCYEKFFVRKVNPDHAIYCPYCKLENKITYSLNNE